VHRVSGSTSARNWAKAEALAHVRGPARGTARHARIDENRGPRHSGGDTPEIVPFREPARLVPNFRFDTSASTNLCKHGARLCPSSEHSRAQARVSPRPSTSPQAGLRRTRPKRARYLCSTAGVCRLTRRPRRARIGRTRSRGRAGPDDPDRGQAITRLAGGARVLAVETDRPGTATVAAGRRDYSRVADEARCLQSGVERDPQLALSRSPALPLSRSRKRRKADVLAATGRSIKGEVSRMPRPVCLAIGFTRIRKPAPRGRPPADANGLRRSKCPAGRSWCLLRDLVVAPRCG
jgi:hypothetical protein